MRDDILTDIAGLPACVAIPLAELEAETHPVVKLWRLCDVAELLLRLMTAIGAADLETSEQGLPDAVAREVVQRIYAPTLFQWLEMALALSEPAVPGRIVLELPGAVRTVLSPLLTGALPGKTTTAGLEEALIPLRNHLAHGAGFGLRAAGEVLGPQLERLRDALARLPWLWDVTLAACDSDGQWIALTGPDPSQWRPIALEQLPQGIRRYAGAVTLLHRGRHVELWPLHAYLPPQLERTGARSLEAPTTPAPLVYRRRGRRWLEMTALGALMPIAELGQEALERLDRLFRVDVRARLSGEEQDTSGEFAREARGLVGRQAEVRHVLDRISGSVSGVLWLHGLPGRGKSAVMATVVRRLQDATPPNSRLICYRFRDGDPRSTHERFLRHAIDCLEAWEPLGARPVRMGANLDQLATRLGELLRRVTAPLRVVVLVDGLDEIARHDPAFIALPFQLSAPAVLWVCAGRPEPALTACFRPDRCTLLFPGQGLPPLRAEDVGEWLKRDAPQDARDLIVRGEPEQAPAPWIREIALRSEGLPAYITLLLEDLKARQVQVGSLPPPGLIAYFDRILERNGLDDEAAIFPTVMAIIALAVEAPDEATLAEVLRRAALLDASTRETHADIVRRVILRAGAMLQVVSTLHGSEGYVPYHDALRHRLLTSPTLRNARAQAERGWAALARAPMTADTLEVRGFAFQVGVRHLLRQGPLAAQELLLEHRYLTARLQLAIPARGGPPRRQLWKDFASVLDALLREGRHREAARLVRHALVVAASMARQTPAQPDTPTDRADEVVAWLTPVLIQQSPLPPTLVRLLIRCSSARAPVSRKLAREVATRHPRVPGTLLIEAVRSASAVERSTMSLALFHRHATHHDGLQIVRLLTPTLLRTYPNRAGLLVALELSLHLATNPRDREPNAHELLAHWLEKIGRPWARTLLSNTLTARLAIGLIDGQLRRKHRLEPDVPPSSRAALERLREARARLEPLLPFFLSPEPAGFAHYGEHCLYFAQQVFGPGRALMHGLLLLQGIWHWPDARAILREVFERGGPDAKMFVHAVLLRIFQQTPREETERRLELRDEILRIADLERELPHFYLDVGPGLGRSVYHPLAPAAAVCAELQPDQPLSYFVTFIEAAKQRTSDERRRRLRRACRDLLWAGMYYPAEAFATLPALASVLDEAVRSELADVVAQLSVAQPALAEECYSRHLAQWIEWPDLVARVDYAWLERYVKERGAGRSAGALLLKEPRLRQALVDLLERALLQQLPPHVLLQAALADGLALMTDRARRVDPHVGDAAAS